MKKIDPRLPSLPSLEDLLAHPTVQGAVERLNQTTIAQRATGFIEELRENLLDRAGTGVIPSAEQLAERLVRRLLGAKPTSSQVINATGIVGGNPQLAPPLAETALHRMIQVLGEYHGADQALAEHVTQLICKTAGAEAAWVTHSFAEAKSACQRLTDYEVVVARDAGLVNPQQWNLQSIATLSELLEQADAVVNCGSGMLGGPACGIVVGKRGAIESLSNSGSSEVAAIGSERLEALAATLQIYATEQHVEHQIPVLQLLSTPTANLQQRADRLAALLNDVDSVQSAKPVECDSTWWQTEDDSLVAPSWAIEIEFNSGTGDARMKQLAEAAPKLLIRVESDRLLLDLRSVFPRWDQQLVARIEAL